MFMPYNLANHNTVFKEYNLTAVPTSFLANLQKQKIHTGRKLCMEHLLCFYKP